MNIKTTHLAIVLFVLLSSSCSTEIDKGNTFPDGKYPLTFASSVEAMVETRANTAGGGWTTGDRIAVRVEGESEVKEYGYGNDAIFTVVSGDPFYWTSAEETKTVSAWYCGTGYSGSVPDTWSVQSDQSGADDYQQSDFLYAPAKEIKFKEDSKSLTFYHQTARVVINIKNAEAATKEGDIKSVAIGHANNLALSGTYTAPVSTGVTAGTWVPATTGSGMGTITPKDITASASGILRTYTALVIPQNMYGKGFLTVTLSNDQVHYYTPAGSEANLESGQVYTYNVTVKTEKIDVVAVSSSGSWGGGTEEDVNSTTPAP